MNQDKQQKDPAMVALDDQLFAAITDGQDKVIALHLKASRLGDDGLPLRHAADRLAETVSSARDAMFEAGDATRKIIAYSDLVEALDSLPC